MVEVTQWPQADVEVKERTNLGWRLGPGASRPGFGGGVWEPPGQAARGWEAAKLGFPPASVTPKPLRPSQRGRGGRAHLPGGDTEAQAG